MIVHTTPKLPRCEESVAYDWIQKNGQEEHTV